MVKRATSFSDKNPTNAGGIRWTFLIALASLILYFGFPPFVEKDDTGNFRLSEERLKEKEEKKSRSENVEVYKLIAAEPGYYTCLRCANIDKVWLNAGEVWKYGISRYGESRYSKKFYASQKLAYVRIITTDIFTAEQMEKELIITYPLLPECQIRMKKYQIFLKRPPGNAKDA